MPEHPNPEGDGHAIVDASPLNPSPLTSRDRQPRIGIVMPIADQRGGAERLLQLLLERYPSNDHLLPSIDLAFLANGPMVAEARRSGHHVTVLPAGRLRDTARYLHTVRGIRKWLEDRQPGVVLSWMAKAHLYVSPAARGLGIPRMWYQHGIPDKGWLDRAATALPCEGVIACSAVAAAAQVRLRPRRQTHVVYPAVETAGPQFVIDPRSQLNLSVAGPILILVSRLERWKGVDRAI